MELTNIDPSTMAGTKSFAERMEGIEDEEFQHVGLQDLGTHMSNTQILEQAFMVEEKPAGGKLDEEDIEIDMMDDDDEGTPLKLDTTTQRGKYAEESPSPKKIQNDSAALFGTELPKSRSSFPRADRSRSPTKAMYPDLNHNKSSQGSKDGPRRFFLHSKSETDTSNFCQTAVPPKHASKSIANDPNLRQAFRSQTLVQSNTPTPRRKLTKINKNRKEDMEKGTKSYENEQSLLTSQKRPSSPSQSEDEFESADEGPESTLKERFKAAKTEAEILRNEVFMLKRELKETQGTDK